MYASNTFQTNIKNTYTHAKLQNREQNPFKECKEKLEEIQFSA